MTPRKEFAIRLGSSAALGMWVFFFCFDLGDVFSERKAGGRLAGQATTSGIACLILGCLLGLFTYQVHKGDGQHLFAPASPNQRKSARRMAIPWFIFFGVFVIKYVWDSPSPRQQAIQVGFIFLGAALMALALWFGFGRWLRERIAQAKTGIGQG